MGRLVSDLLAQALREDAGPAAGPPPGWISRPMGARADHTDKEALHRALAGQWLRHFSCLQKLAPETSFQVNRARMSQTPSQRYRSNRSRVCSYSPFLALSSFNPCFRASGRSDWRSFSTSSVPLYHTYLGESDFPK